MRRRNAKLLTALGALGVSVLAASGGLAWADGTSSGGEVHLYEADTALAGTLGTVILTGAITDHGTDHQGGLWTGSTGLSCRRVRFRST